MRKIVLLTALFASFTISAMAQFFAVTHTTGAAVINGETVTVTSIGTNPAPTNYCSAGPYFIGATQPGGYQYNFAPGNVTDIRMNITDFQQDDTIEIEVNGTPYNVTNAMLTAFATCTDISSPAASAGKVVCTAGSGIRTDATLTFSTSPAFMNTVRVLHNRRNTNSGGVIYSLEFKVDSCGQAFTFVADSPRCKDRDMQLVATNFPNTSYVWTTSAGTGSWSPSNTVYNPKYLTLPFSAGVTFTVNATRGACTYTSSKTFSVGNTPAIGVMSFQGPKCTGDKDTVTFPSGVGTVGGSTYIITPAGNTIQCSIAPTNNFIELPNIQTTDAGLYRGYAISIEGCTTDTGSVIVSLNPVVKADFIFDNKFGCASDSVQFYDQSLGNNTWNWTFGDGGNSNIDNPLHIYASQGTYTVKLVTTNGKCADSMSKLVVLNHPLTADITSDVDSICQGKTVVFTNNSVATPATLPRYFWDFKDGDTSDQFNVSHLYTRYGVYDVTMTITDYLGCKKTATKRIVVDSLGSASFFSDTVLCNGQNIKFLGDYSLIGGTFAEWDFNDGHYIKDKFTIEHAFDEPGTYLVKLTANYRICPDTTYEQNILVKPYPTVDLGKDTSICPNGQSFVIKDLINSATGAPVKWRWNTETKDSLSFINVHHPGKYSVTVDQDGCVATDTIEIRKNCYIDIPNVFTPNGDGYNDYFLPRQLLSSNVSKFSMTVFNRWGDIVFETNSINGRGWDGKLNDKEQPGGVYIYLIKVSFGNGTNENYQGNVTLLR